MSDPRNGHDSAHSGPPLGLSGHLTRFFIDSPLTPLILLVAILFGALALAMLPREEEPQISVPMVDVLVQADGLRAPDAVELVTKTASKRSSRASARSSMSIRRPWTTGWWSPPASSSAQRKMRPCCVCMRRSVPNFDRIPIGIPEPLIVGRGINDVAVVVLTLTPRPRPGRRALDQRRPFSGGGRAAGGADQGRPGRLQLSGRRPAGSDPDRA